jgi:hypothetical protein
MKQAEDCGCCKGLTTQTPQTQDNPPGRSTLAYRVGTHSRFKASLLARLSSQYLEFPDPNDPEKKLPLVRPLGDLTTRDDDDATIALFDAWASTLDVLSFYQERIVNEGFLRTASERRSILELARSIGYELSPGVAASTYLAFELESVVGSPKEVPILKGTKVQSLPNPGEQAQFFETTEELQARPEWNTLMPRLTQARTPLVGDRTIRFKGVNLNLKIGDWLLFVDSGDNTELRQISAVMLEPNQNQSITRVDWADGLSKNAQEVYTFRARAALFGHNAPDWKAMSKETKESYIGSTYIPATHTDWPFTAVTNATLPLDARYPAVIAQSWVVLEQLGSRTPLKVLSAQEVVVSGFTLSSNVTQIEVSKNISRPNLADLRQISLWVQSEGLELAEYPLSNALLSVALAEGTLTPLMGSEIHLESFVQGLLKNHTLIVQGRPSRVQIDKGKISFSYNEGTAHRNLSKDEILTVLAPPVKLSNGSLNWQLMDAKGVTGEAVTSASDLRLLPADADPKAEFQAEVVQLKEDVEPGGNLVLASALTKLYDLATVTLLANVAPATHGESKTEVLGSGDAGQANQSFVLKQKPLTYLSATNAEGCESTLELRVNDLLWEEVPSLYGRSPKEEVYVTRQAEDGSVQVQFGDGVMGARVPSGVENIKANYRVGTGLAGMLEAGQLSLLLTRPLGLKGVKGPLVPNGAEDPEPRDMARQNAPLQVLTLGRIVSLQDYEDFTRAFAGIGKAQATWLWNGQQRVIHLTIAGADASPVETGSQLYLKLLDAITQLSLPRQVVQVQSYIARPFRVKANMGLEPRYLPEKVRAAVETTVAEQFSFDKRDFARGVSASEVMGVIQGVEGVRFVDLDTLYFTTPGNQSPPPPLLASRAVWDNSNKRYTPAELVTLHPHGLELEVRS